LEYGGGGTTICEVTITTGLQYRVAIEPYTDEEVIQFVRDFCAGLLDDQSSGENERGVPKEIDRALRNMTGLKIDRTKGPGGKRSNKDRAAELARTLPPESLRSEVFTLLRMWERTTTTITHDPGTDPDGKAWLRKIFAAVNKGQRPDVGLPRRITVTVPFRLLPGTALNISVIDTKGIDGSPLRPDLTACLENPRMVAVVCSSFNDAPGPIFEQLLKQAIDTGTSTTAFPRIVGLALARSGEAKKMRDDGEFVRLEEDGYDLQSRAGRGRAATLGLQRRAGKRVQRQQRRPRRHPRSPTGKASGNATRVRRTHRANWPRNRPPHSGYNPLPEGQGWGARLLRQRTTLGLSQKASAERLGIDPSTLAKWERGEREPAGALLSRVKRFLDEEEESKAIGPVLGTLQLATP